MRRKDREITDFKELVHIIKRCKVCHVAFCGEEYPYVVPMNFGIKIKDDEIELYFHGAKTGKKHELIHKNNKVAFVMEITGELISERNGHACTYSMEYESVMGKGVMEYITETEEKTEALNYILKQYKVQSTTPPHFPIKMLEVTSVFRLKVLEISGKRRPTPF